MTRKTFLNFLPGLLAVFFLPQQTLADPAPLVPTVFVTEALTHTDLPLRDSIEIHNPTDNAVDITGWFLTDKVLEPNRWKIPPTVIAAGGYVVFYESDAFGNVFPENFGYAFSLNSTGEDVYIFSADSGENLTGFSHGFSFGASSNGVSFGRHVTSIGEEHFVLQQARTLGAPNAGAQVGPVVITELMYHPAGTHDDFIEIMNISSQPVKLYDSAHPENTWLVGGIAYAFPQGIELAAGEIILVVPVQPEAFRLRYSISSSTRIFGPFTGNLSNGGEKIRLRKPDSPNSVDGLWEVPYIDLDSISYLDEAPWPDQPDGNGPSLERISPTAYADDPANWRTSLANGGTPGLIDENPPLSYQDWLIDHQLTGSDAAPDADRDGDGVANLLEYAFGMDPTIASLSGLPTPGRIQQEGAEYLTITFDRRIEATGIQVAPAFGGDLLSWPEEAAPETAPAAPNDDGITERVTVRDTMPLVGSPRRFGRVRVFLD